MTVVAGYGIVLCGHSDDLHHRYRGRIEKVKFGVPINEAFAHDIPATLLVLLLKVNKEGPVKKDIWRAPGNQAHVRKLSQIMQHGRLVNIANFSVYTAASVIKKFLSKLPGGIFGAENEQVLFTSVLNNPDEEKQRQVFCRLFCSLPVPSQHLLVLLFGTFRMIADCADDFGTKMTPEAIGISVAPSLFHTCIHDGKVKVEDVERFKLASQVVSQIIRSFGHTNLFPRECYEFYARITGRTLRVDENWLFSFQYPSRSRSHPEVVVADAEEIVEGEERDGSGGWTGGGKLGHRLSNSLGHVPLTKNHDGRSSLTFLATVHARQKERMLCRSEWFLSPVVSSRPSSAAAMHRVVHEALVHSCLSDTDDLDSNRRDQVAPSNKSSTSSSSRIQGTRAARVKRSNFIKTSSLDASEESSVCSGGERKKTRPRRASLSGERRTEMGEAPAKKRSTKKHHPSSIF